MAQIEKKKLQTERAVTILQQVNSEPDITGRSMQLIDEDHSKLSEINEKRIKTAKIG